MSLPSEYGDLHENSIRKGRARPLRQTLISFLPDAGGGDGGGRWPVRVPNSDNDDLRDTFHRNSAPCPSVDKILLANFGFIDQYGKRGLSGLPTDLSNGMLHINMYSGVYKDDTSFKEDENGLVLRYQKPKKDKYNKTNRWFEEHRYKKVYVITPSMGGRILEGILETYDGKDLSIKVC